MNLSSCINASNARLNCSSLSIKYGESFQRICDQLIWILSWKKINYRIFHSKNKKNPQNKLINFSKENISACTYLLIFANISHCIEMFDWDGLVFLPSETLTLKKLELKISFSYTCIEKKCEHRTTNSL